MKIEVVDFETVRTSWVNNLWLGRTDVKPMSSMVYNNPGVHDMTIYTKYNPTFWAMFDQGNVIAVNSGFRTEDDLYRSRGIWVHPSHRGYGISREFFEVLQNQAEIEDCEAIWSYPKRDAIKAYEAAGFQRTSQWFDNNDYGVNCYVLKDIMTSK